ncbi:MAG TPA: phytanoyl-CoA dioxygenase family protein [Acidimicrobiia bacterium]
MISLDVRTRTDDDVRDVDTVDFFTRELPDLIASRGELAAPGAAELGCAPFAFSTPRGAWTLSLQEGSLRIEAGQQRATAVVALRDEELADIVNDLATPMTHVTGGTLRMERGQLGAFLDWWVVLRALVDGRPAYTSGTVTFRDRKGAPLDLRRTFTLDDDPAELAHFLAQAGFLHVTGVFTPEEMASVDADMTAAGPTYARDDGRSWWARTADGKEMAVRLQRFEQHSPTAAELLTDERFLAIGGLTDDEYVASTTVEALEKPLGVVEGISDVPWHKDCSLGRHAYRCSSLTVGISVTGADDVSGQLRVVAGSHRALVQPAFVRPEWGLPVVDLPTTTGDVTVHCSCTLHMAQPPVERPRRVMYTGFSLADPDNRARAGEAAIRRVRESSYKNVSQKPGHIAGT